MAGTRILFSHSFVFVFLLFCFFVALNSERTIGLWNFRKMPFQLAIHCSLLFIFVFLLLSFFQQTDFCNFQEMPTETRLKTDCQLQKQLLQNYFTKIKSAKFASILRNLKIVKIAILCNFQKKIKNLRNFYNSTFSLSNVS